MIVFWVIFLAIVLVLLALDLGVFNREAHTIGMREAVGWTIVWICVSLLFNGFVWLAYDNHWWGAGLGENGEIVRSGGTAALEFFLGYLLEKSLSVDNIFVIALVFGYFKVPSDYQHRVLFWGILGAIIFRGALIGVGALLVKQGTWIFPVFGAILLWAAYKMVFGGDEETDPEKSWIFRFAKRVLPIKSGYYGERFTIFENGKRYFTTLFVVLLVIEATDVVFAFDSIPAIFGVTTDPFIVMTSNIFAILGLRAMYFVLAGMIDRFHYLSYALAIVLAFVAVKLMLHDVVKIPHWLSLSVIVVTLVAGVWLSIRSTAHLADTPLVEGATTDGGADPPEGDKSAAAGDSAA